MSFFLRHGAQLAGDRFRPGRGTVVVRGLAFFFLPPSETVRDRGDGVGFVAGGGNSDVAESRRFGSLHPSGCPTKLPETETERVGRLA